MRQSKKQVSRKNQVSQGLQAKQPKNRKLNKTYFYLAGLLILTLLIYSKVPGYGFLNWDDPSLVTDNPYIKYIHLYSFSDFFSLSFLQKFDPLTVISHAILFVIFGFNPMVFHIGNIILHLFNILLVFWIVKLMTRDFSVSLIAASFFALHPSHVESVAWIAERKDVLYAFFFLLSIVSYIYYIKSNLGIKFFIISVLAFGLSLLSKFAAVTLPVVLLLFDYYFKRPFYFRLFIEKIPFFILAMGLGIVHFSTTEAKLSTQVVSQNFNLIDRFFMGLFSSTYYFFSSIIPLYICPVHPYPDKVSGFLPIFYYLSFFIFFGILTLFFFLARKNKNIRRDLVFGFLFFLINIGLVVHIIPFGGWVVVADRYSYIPYFGLFFIIAMIYNWINENKIKTFKVFKSTYLPLVAIILMIYSIYSFIYSQNWKNNTSFWSGVIEKYPSNSSSAIAYYGLGIAKADSKDFVGAMNDYNTAINLKPQFADAYNNRGKIKQDNREYESSILDFNKCLSLDPSFTKAYHNRGYSFYFLKKYDNAISDYNKAIELDHEYYEAFDNRGIVKFLKSDYLGAIKDYNIAISLKPDFAEAFNNRGGAYFYLKNFENAESDYSKAILLNQDVADYFKNRCYTRIQLNNRAGACDDYIKAGTLGFKIEDPAVKQLCK